TTKVRFGTIDLAELDTKFYPQIHICFSGLQDSQYIVPGTTRVRLCDGSGSALATNDYRGYTVSAQGLSTSACPAAGGGVCPADDNDADFSGLTGTDILDLAQQGLKYTIKDKYAGVDVPEKPLPRVEMVYYGELRTHLGSQNLGAGKDTFRINQAQKWCHLQGSRYGLYASGLSTRVARNFG
ncbi:hypothetical protein EHA31_24265, partial [Salmonella enterica]|nr:hypothetical protein [Salmonella enterica]